MLNEGFPCLQYLLSTPYIPCSDNVVQDVIIHLILVAKYIKITSRDEEVIEKDMEKEESNGFTTIC